MSASPPSALHVLVIGGGIGGLCLAQGLKKAGISVAVYERDRIRTDRLQGYRVHINPKGSRALHECLPAELYDAFVATCGRSDYGFHFMDENLKKLLFIEPALMTTPSDDPVERPFSASRITLRQVLMAGLDDVIHFDKKFVKYELEADGRVTAVFDDGTTATGDVLVGADGGSSGVRGQYLPHAERIDTGMADIAGKVLLTEETRDLLPAELFDGPAIVMARKGLGMFVGVQEFSQVKVALPYGIGGNDASAGDDPNLAVDNTADYIMWAFHAPRQKYPVQADLGAMDGPALQSLALEMIKDWDPRLSRLVRASDPSTVTTLAIRSSTPVDPWQPTTVTLIGDAIHSMTPFRGVGANTALRDAALLCRNLVATQTGQLSLVAAIGDYEAQMRSYGFDAVRVSLQTMHKTVIDNPVALFMAKRAFRVFSAVTPLRRKVFGNFGNP